MKKLQIALLAVIAAIFASTAVWSVILAASPKALKPLQLEEKEDPLDGIVYFKNPVTGKLALYVSFELQPGHAYAISVTSDGVTWSEPYIKSNTGTNDVYLSFNVDPCPASGDSVWPRCVDLGPSPTQ